MSLPNFVVEPWAAEMLAFIKTVDSRVDPSDTGMASTEGYELETMQAVHIVNALKGAGYNWAGNIEDGIHIYASPDAEGNSDRGVSLSMHMDYRDDVVFMCWFDRTK